MSWYIYTRNNKELRDKFHCSQKIVNNKNSQSDNGPLI